MATDVTLHDTSRHEIGRLTSTSRLRWLAVWHGIAPLELRLGSILAALAGRKPVAFVGPQVVNPRPEK